MWAWHPGFLLGSQSCRCAASVRLTPLTEAPGPRRTAGIHHPSHQHKLNRLIQKGSRPWVYRNTLSKRVFPGVPFSGAVQGLKVRNCPMSGAETGFSRDKQGWHSPDMLCSLFFFFSWRLITLQYCSGFCHTLTWMSHGFTCIPHPEPPPPISLPIPSHPSGSSQCTSPEHLSHASNLGWRSVSYLIIYMFQCIHSFSQSGCGILMWRQHPWKIVLAADNNTASARQDPRRPGKQWDLIVECRWLKSGNTYPQQGAWGFKRRISEKEVFVMHF